MDARVDSKETELVHELPCASQLAQRYSQVRKFSQRLCERLAPEDCVVQSMPDVSPIKWHLAHTTWFFETFVLSRAFATYEPFEPAYGYLFNSYYNSVGKQFPRPQRGVITRPTVEEILDYRHTIDRRISEFFEGTPESDQLLQVVELGLHHEQQHQELMLTDIKHIFSCNPLWPKYQDSASRSDRSGPLKWERHGGGISSIGHNDRGFAFDNELPRHRVLVEPNELASRLVTNAEFLEFVEDGGYECPELWLSLGWNTVVSEKWHAPIYWQSMDGEWHEFTLSGLRPLGLDHPVCHISYFEADAYARWRGVRLPTEQEWEVNAAECDGNGHFAESGIFHPLPAGDAHGSRAQMLGSLWEWTASPYTPYPGYRPVQGALGEYNGKFMCNQYVLRGGSCATPGSHIRATYRNFFSPEARWQFTGLRLAR